MKQLEKILKSLANSRRLQAISFIKQRKKPTVGEIAEHLKLSFSATSRHLSLLENAGILDKKQSSLEVRYFIASQLPKEISTIVDNL